MEAICPSCKRAVYSRKRTTCGYCGAVLPEEFHMSLDEIAAMQAEIAAIEHRRQAEKAKEEKEKEEQQGSDGGFDGGIFLG
jgi:hypothetical protein